MEDDILGKGFQNKIYTALGPTIDPRKRRKRIWGWITIVGMILFFGPILLTFLGCWTSENIMGCGDYLILFIPLYLISIPLAFVGMIGWLISFWR